MCREIVLLLRSIKQWSKLLTTTTKKTLTQDEIEEYRSSVEYVLDTHHPEKLNRCFEMSIDYIGASYDDEDEYGEIFDAIVKARGIEGTYNYG